jgi:hypothetical protein
MKKKVTKPKKKVAPKVKAAPKKKAPAKKKAAPAKKKPAVRSKSPRPPPPPPDALLERPVHPKLTWLLQNLPPGRYAGGLLQISPLGTHARELEPWLMGRTAGRFSIGRTAFGEPLVFRDLREHAASLGMEDAELACDVAAIDIHFKRMKVLSTSAEEFVQLLDDPEWQQAFLRKPMFDAVKARLGDWGADECYCFVPALALGGSESAESVERVNWAVHQSLLLQM